MRTRWEEEERQIIARFRPWKNESSPDNRASNHVHIRASISEHFIIGCGTERKNGWGREKLFHETGLAVRKMKIILERLGGNKNNKVKV